MASCSACVIQSRYSALTAVCRATYSQRNPLFAGSQVAASPSDLEPLAGPSAASRFSGSFASCRRSSALSCWAPFCHASESATTWSICTAVLVVLPRTKAMVLPVYGSANVPEATTHSLVPSLYTTSTRSRARMSFRVSQPLWSTSAQAGPNCSRS